MSVSNTARPAVLKRAKRRAAKFFGAWGVFFKGFLKHPVMVGSVIPSSRATVDKMLSRCDWEHTKLFVEYGPGVGTFCQPVLDKLRHDAALLVIDLNPDFIDYLNKHIHDSRFIAVNGSAENVNEIIKAAGFEHADYIVSGLPFSTLPADVGPAIARETERALRPGGAFLVYQFREKARDYMTPYFQNIDRDFIWWNIPPCHLFWGWKS